MKTGKFCRAFTLFFVLMTIVSCVKKDDFDVPNTEIGSPDIDPNSVIEISALRGLLLQEQTTTGNPDAVLTFEETN